MPDATSDAPDLKTFARLDEPGLAAVGQRLEPGRALLECRVVTRYDASCRRCGAQGTARETVTRRLAHALFGWVADGAADQGAPLGVRGLSVASRV